MTYTYSTTFLRPCDIKRRWWLVDAKNIPLGRLASRIANVLRGKHKASYTPYLNCGDSVIVINAGFVKLTGKKAENSLFHWHTGYSGGIKSTSFKKILSGKYPERLLLNAVRRMLPKESPLARRIFGNLYVYSGTEHPHAGQMPVFYENLLK